jgi:2'-5' RNA ligase
MRCFVGLWPDASARERLAQLGTELHRRVGRARLIPPHNIHLTLAFIGTLDPITAHRLATALAGLRPEAASWVVDTIGMFDRARVLWVGGESCPPLAKLALAVRRLLGDLEIVFDEKPFAAHITLLRDFAPQRANHLIGPIRPPIAFPLSSPRLLVSEATRDGVRYRDFGMRAD